MSNTRCGGTSRQDSTVTCAPTLVFLHGVGLSRRLWRPQLTALADFRCLTPDLPEHGENRAAAPFTLDGAARDVAALIRARATGGRAHVVGLSLGGAVALTLLRLVPDVVQSVLVSGVAAPLPWPVRGVARLAAGAVTLMPRGLLTTAATVPVRLPWGPYAVPASERAAICGDLRRSFTPAFLHHVALALTDLEVPAAASAPVLVLVGGRELWGSRAAARYVVGRIEGACGGVVPGVGHLWNLQAPDLFAGILRAWASEDALPALVQPL